MKKPKTVTDFGGFATADEVGRVQPWLYDVVGTPYSSALSITGINLFRISSNAVESDLPPANARTISAFLLSKKVVGYPHMSLKFSRMS